MAEARTVMKILIAVDGSLCSDAAVNETVTRPWPSNSEFRIVSAFQVPMTPTPEVWALNATYYNEMEKALSAQAQNVVESSASKLKKALGQSANVTGQILAGPPSSAILEEAERWGADLIVVGSHGYGTWHRLVLGSVSQAVVLHAKCSVEVVRHDNCKKVAEAA
jgi:nucleotide-binding universal stress UspA family protein